MAQVPETMPVLRLARKKIFFKFTSQKGIQIIYSYKFVCFLNKSLKKRERDLAGKQEETFLKFKQAKRNLKGVLVSR